MKKQRLFEFDLIRALACIVIVIYHFSASIQTINTGDWARFDYFTDFVNGNLGEITVVSLFFMISGACLYLSNDAFDAKTLLTFYKKRWLAIFPAFYLVWGFIYLQNVLLLKSFFFLGKKKLLLSLLGMDGYTAYLGPNYYSVGEWFLGALIILYLLFPLLVLGINKSQILTALPIIAGFILFLVTDFVKMSDLRNPFTCLIAFYMGMVFAKNLELFKKKWLLLISLPASLILLFVPLSINHIICMILLAFMLMITFFHLGTLLKEIAPIKSAFSFLSSITYEIFLLHHVLVNYVLQYFSLTKLTLGAELLLLAAIFAATVFFAYILKCVVNHALKRT